MDPIVGTVIKAGILGGSSMLSGLGSYFATRETNKSNVKINDKNLDFAKEQFQYQKYLNNNQFQIQSADAQKAGINPLAMTAGSLNGGSYSNASHPMETPQLGDLSNAVSRFLEMQTQKEISDKTNETNASIADANNKNSKDIAILKVLSDEKIADNLNKAQLDRLVRSLGSQEKIASWTIGEQKRHNIATENLQDKLVDSQVVLNNSQASYNDKKIALEAVNSQLDNYIKEVKNERDKQELENSRKQLETDIRDKKWKHAKIVIDSILGVLGIAGDVTSGILPGLLHGAPNKIGF